MWVSYTFSIHTRLFAYMYTYYNIYSCILCAYVIKKVSDFPSHRVHFHKIILHWSFQSVRSYRSSHEDGSDDEEESESESGDDSDNEEEPLPEGWEERIVSNNYFTTTCPVLLLSYILETMWSCQPCFLIIRHTLTVKQSKAKLLKQWALHY